MREYNSYAISTCELTGTDIYLSNKERIGIDKLPSSAVNGVLRENIIVQQSYCACPVLKAFGNSTGSENCEESMR